MEGTFRVIDGERDHVFSQMLFRLIERMDRDVALLVDTSDFLNNQNIDFIFENSEKLENIKVSKVMDSFELYKLCVHLPKEIKKHGAKALFITSLADPFLGFEDTESLTWMCKRLSNIAAEEGLEVVVGNFYPELRGIIKGY